MITDTSLVFASMELGILCVMLLLPNRLSVVHFNETLAAQSFHGSNHWNIEN